MATVSHELRTPLARARLRRAAAHAPPRRGPRREFLGTVHREAKRLSSLIDDFLDLQSIEEGGLALVREPFDLGGVADGARASFRRPERGAPARADARSRRCGVRRPGRIAQVVANLLSNAIKYSPDGGVVGSTRSCGTAWCGCRHRRRPGHSAGRAARSSRSSSASSSSETARVGGTGLGLALAHEIVGPRRPDRVQERRGRRLDFWFELPRGRAEGIGTLPRRAPSSSRTTRRPPLYGRTWRLDGCVVDRRDDRRARR